jgi:hypothetical protein
MPGKKTPENMDDMLVRRSVSHIGKTRFVAANM